MPEQRSKKPRFYKAAAYLLLTSLLVFGVVLVGGFLLGLYREAEDTAQYSAQAALLVEIEGLLEGIPKEGTYPASLGELPLTYPDGGDASTLSLFEYESDGKSCTLKTWISLRDEWVVVSYPQREGP